jgi:hypothetical protein
MKGNYWHVADAIDPGIRPRSGRQIRNGANIEMIPKSYFGRCASLFRFSRNREDDFVDKLSARQPVQVPAHPV